MDITTDTGAPNRRWQQFSLRGLLLLVSVVAIYAAAYRASETWGGQAIVSSLAAAVCIYGGTLLRDLATRRLRTKRPSPFIGFITGYAMLFGYAQAILAVTALLMCAFRR